jgi:hypothetical protein
MEVIKLHVTLSCLGHLKQLNHIMSLQDDISNTANQEW